MRQSDAKIEKKTRCHSCWQCKKVVLPKYVEIKGCGARQVIILWSSRIVKGKLWILIIGKVFRESNEEVRHKCNNSRFLQILQ